MTDKPTPDELEQGFKECYCGKGIQLLQSGFEVPTSSCVQCGEHVADRDEFFNVPAELMSK